MPLCTNEIARYEKRSHVVGGGYLPSLTRRRIQPIILELPFTHSVYRKVTWMFDDRKMCLASTLEVSWRLMSC
jgi:hypothetical protein